MKTSISNVAEVHKAVNNFRPYPVGRSQGRIKGEHGSQRPMAEVAGDIPKAEESLRR
jgi:hypothetical protein